SDVCSSDLWAGGGSLDLPRLAELAIREQLRQPGDLLEPQDLVGLHAELLADLLVAPVAPRQLLYDRAHGLHAVLPPRAVVADRGRHAVADGGPVRVDRGHRQVAHGALTHRL